MAKGSTEHGAHDRDAVTGGGYGVARRSETGPGPDEGAQDQVSVAEVERIIAGIPGVDRAKVVVNDWGSIDSIHVLGDTSRPAKRVVRDIESALAAQVGLLVDRRKISLAQIRSGGRPAVGPRLLLGSYGIDADTLLRRTLVRVSLVSPDETRVRYEGAAESDTGDGSTEDALIRATLRALEQALPPDVHVAAAGHRRLAESSGTIRVTLVRVVRDGLGETVSAGAWLEGSSPPEAIIQSVLAAVAEVISRTGLRPLGDKEPDEGMEEDDFV